MKKQAILIIVILTSLSVNSWAQTGSLPSNFYKYFSGTIDGEPVSVSLQSLAGAIWGICDYPKANIQTLWVINAGSSWNNYLYFTEKYSKGGNFSTKAVWKGVYEDNKFSGIRRAHDQQKGQSFVLNEDYPKGTLRFMYIVQDKSISLGEDKTIEAIVQSDVPVATGHSKKANWLNQQINHVLEIPKGQSPQKYVDEQVKKAIPAIQKHFGQENGVSSGNWAWLEQRLILYNHFGYVVMSTSFQQRFNNNKYTISKDFCFDVKNRKRLGLSDIIHIKPIELKPILNKYFRSLYQLDSSATLLTHLPQDIKLTDAEISFNRGGMFFTYNHVRNPPASGTSDFISVHVPWKALKGYLNPEFARRMKLNL